MSTASNFLPSSNAQSVCQTSAFIGSGHSRNACHDAEGDESFSADLQSCMQVQLVPISAIRSTVTTIVSESSIAWTNPVTQSPSAASGASGASADTLMSLLQGLEQEISHLTSELQAAEGLGAVPAGAGASTSTTSASSAASQGSTSNPAAGLQGDYQTLYNEAADAVQDGSSFDLTLPSGETMTGSFSWGELEPAGDNALFTPGDPSAPDAGRNAFDNALAQFLSLAQSDSGSTSAAGQVASYSTTTSFTGNNTSIAWSGTFLLAPEGPTQKS